MATSRRTQNLRRLLEQRKRQLTAEMQDMMRTVRHESRAERTADQQDVAESETRSDIDLAVIQMKAETVARVEAALRRLEQGGHGDCAACGDKISIERLTAVPFALRCRDCEASREKAKNGGSVRAGTAWRDSIASSLD